MAPHSAVLKSSQSLQSFPAIARQDDAKGSPATPSSREGSFRGHDVVVGLTAPQHRVASYRTLLALSALDALVVGAGLYTGASAWQAADSDDAQAYAPQLINVLSGAAGLVVGGALPSLISRTVHAFLCRAEANLLRRPGHDSAQAQLEALVRHATLDSPLTLDGLRACIGRIHVLRRLRGNELPAQDVAQALGQLGQVVPTGQAGCRRCNPAPDDQFDLLLAQLTRLHADDELTSAAYRQALVSLASHLPAPAEPDEREVALLADRLLQACKAAAPADGKSSSPTQLWAATDFMVSLCGTRYFAPHAQAIQLKASKVLGCNPRAYTEALPVTSKRSQSGIQAATSIQEVTDRISQAPVQKLKDKVGSAIGIAMNNKRPPVDQARYLLAILHALAARTDLPPGAFLEGLLRPQAVQALAQAIVEDARPLALGLDKAELIAALPRLCQLQATGTMMTQIVQALRSLLQHAPGAGDAATRAARQARLDESVEAAFTAVDARITGIRQDPSIRVGSGAWFRLLSSPAASLHHPWLAGAGRKALLAIQPSVAQPLEPEHVEIEIRDFQNPSSAEKG